MGKTSLEMRDALRVDLDDSGALWSDAELNRGVDRAVADLSRFLPLQKVYEKTIDASVSGESFTTPAAASATAIVNAATLSGESDGSTLSIADTTPEVPRRLTLTLTDANFSITELTITVKGYDQDGFYIEESWYLPNLVSGTASQGNLYFSRITGVIVTHIGGSAGAGDTISVGTGNAYDSDVPLANKPIKPKSETVTSDPAGTTYARDTDYTMDYKNGAIRFINGEDMAAATSYLISYTKSKIHLDITSIKREFIRIDRIEYPTHNVPQSMITADLWEDTLTLTGDIEGQSEVADGNHIAIYYYAKHSPPSSDAPGSYPEFLDETIILAAGAYALFNKALQYEHLAVTALSSADTALGKATTALGSTKVDDFLSGATAPSAKSYLASGDDLINVVTVGVSVAERYAIFAQRCSEIAAAFIVQAREHNTNGTNYIAEASQYMALADRFRVDAIERRNEAWAVWRDPGQYIGDVSISPVRQTSR